jgi:hypothetical protein
MKINLVSFVTVMTAYAVMPCNIESKHCVRDARVDEPVAFFPTRPPHNNVDGVAFFPTHAPLSNADSAAC